MGPSGLEEVYNLSVHNKRINQDAITDIGWIDSSGLEKVYNLSGHI